VRYANLAGDFCQAVFLADQQHFDMFPRWSQDWMALRWIVAMCGLVNGLGAKRKLSEKPSEILFRLGAGITSGSYHFDRKENLALWWLPW